MKKLNGLDIDKEFNEMVKTRGKDVHQITLELAEKYNVSWVTIRKEIDKESLKKAKNMLTDMQQKVYNKLNEGMTQSNIAKDLNVSRQNVGYMTGIIGKKGYKIEEKK